MKNKRKKGNIDFRITPEFEKVLGRIDKDIKEGKNLSPAFSSPKEVNDYLNNLYK